MPEQYELPLEDPKPLSSGKTSEGAYQPRTTLLGDFSPSYPGKTFALSKNGQPLVECWEKNGEWPGESSTPSMQAFRSAGAESFAFPSTPRLSQILEPQAQRKYFLSAKACAGILRRAKKRNRMEQLPPALVEALQQAIGTEKARTQP